MTKPTTIPPKPPKPDANECCGGGCVPCILDYYYDALAEWEQKYGEKQQKSMPQEPKSDRQKTGGNSTQS